MKAMNDLYEYMNKEVIVTLYTKSGAMLDRVKGRVADVSSKVKVAEGIKKDLAYVVGIEGYESPHLDQASEGWFAISDLEIVDDDKPDILDGISFN